MARPPKVASSALRPTRGSYMSTYAKGAGATVSSALKGREVRTPKFKKAKPSTGGSGATSDRADADAFSNISFGSTGIQPDAFTGTRKPR